MSDVDITLGAQDKASQVIDGVASKIGGFGASLGALGPVALGVGAVLGGVTAAVASLSGAFNAFMDSASRIDEVAKSATALGSSVSDLQSLEMVLRQVAGVETDDVNGALKEMQLRLGEIASGIGSQEQKDILSQLGLDAATLTTMSPVDQFTEIQNAISNIENVAERASIADKLFGGDGAKLLPAFAADADTFADAMERAGASAQTLTDSQAKGVEAMNDALDTAQTSFMALVDQATASLAPVIESIANQLNQWLPPILEIASTALPFMVDGLVQIAGYATEIAQAFFQLSSFDFSGAINTLGNLGDTSERWLQTVDEARQRAREAADEAARQQDDARSTPPVDQSLVAEQRAKEEAAANTIAQLERQLQVAMLGEDAVRRQEELALATNDIERERIKLLQDQIAAQEQQKTLLEQQKKAEEDAAAERRRQAEEAAEEQQQINESLAGFRPGTQAVEGRLLTRGPSQGVDAKILDESKKMANRLQLIYDVLSTPPNAGERLTVELIGAA